MNSVITPFFQHQLTVKMYHFQTKKYGAHKAADEYLIKYRANLDRFMETYQGETDRLSEKRIRIEFETKNDLTILQHLDAMAEYINGFEKISKGLGAIRDEMLADIYQFKYLLSFD